MARKTREQFIEKAKKIHGNKYDYSSVKYRYYYQDVVILCPIHGKFKQKPGNHIAGNGCQQCARVSRKAKLSKTVTDFIKEARVKHSNKYKYPRSTYAVG